MLGDDLVVAPVLDRNTTEWGLYLPTGNWKSIWDTSRTIIGPQHLTVESEIGFPPVFYRPESRYAPDFEKISIFYGSLPCNIPYEVERDEFQLFELIN